MPTALPSVRPAVSPQLHCTVCVSWIFLTVFWTDFSLLFFKVTDLYASLYDFLSPACLRFILIFVLDNGVELPIP